MNEIQNIPWGKVISNFVWIFGASLILADFSYHEFLSHKTKTPLIKTLKQSSFKTPLLWGVFLIAVGISLSTKNSWVAWVFRGVALVLLIILIRNIKTKKIKNMRSPRHKVPRDDIE